ncbi:SREBP regulating gene protein [Dillenia turbinata]|uniref:SREBP regulating gene protein n=1 Tax=Dillenia turbinata TaxID=194707 RepID=A0AAN8V907_9MAGN
MLAPCTCVLLSTCRRDVGIHGRHNCRTTVQGRYLISDENGYVCDALSVDTHSRCCPSKGEQYSCQGCNLVSQCCNSYEFCVSCCLNPKRTEEQLALKVKIAKPSTAGNISCSFTAFKCCLSQFEFLSSALINAISSSIAFRTYTSVFDFCAGRCRHNSESVVGNLLSLVYVSSLTFKVEQMLCEACYEVLLQMRRKHDMIWTLEVMVSGGFPQCMVIPPLFVGPSLGRDCFGCTDSAVLIGVGTVHENAYVSDFHHCFFLPPNSSVCYHYCFCIFMLTTWTSAEPNSASLDSRLSGINIIVGRQGESCDSVCKSSGKSCVQSKLQVLNNCEIMQKYMSCRGACLASIGADQPAEVVDDAPKHLNPGACLYTQTQTMLSCDGSHRHTRRLCPCA